METEIINLNSPQKTLETKGLNSNTLKIIAIIAMTIDHIAFAFVPYETVLSMVMHVIGRLTGPIMFYAAVEGYHHTRNIKKYILRLFIFAIVSYFPFMLFKAHGIIEDMRFYDFNVIYTIMLGVIGIWIRRNIKNPILKTIYLIIIICISITADWGYLGVFIILSFDFYYKNFKNQTYAYTLLILFAAGLFSMIISPIYSIIYMNEWNIDPEYYFYSIETLGMFLPIIVLKYYNGERGSSKPWSKWLFYIFYPLHLLIIGGIQYYINL